MSLLLLFNQEAAPDIPVSQFRIGRDKLGTDATLGGTDQQTLSGAGAIASAEAVGTPGMTARATLVPVGIGPVRNPSFTEDAFNNDGFPDEWGTPSPWGGYAAIINDSTIGADYVELTVDALAGGTHLLWQEVAAVPGETWTLSVDALRVSGAGDILVELCPADAANEPLGGAFSAWAGPAAWTELSARKEFPAGTTKYFIIVHIRDTAAGSVFRLRNARMASFGIPATSPGPATIAPTGIASAEAIGTPDVDPGAVSILPTGIPSGEAHGLGTIGKFGTFEPPGIASAEAFGTPKWQFVLKPQPIGSDEGTGTPTLLAQATISPTGIPSGEALGTPVITTRATISPVSITTLEAFGTPVVTTRATISATGISSLEAFGTPALTTEAYITPTGIASTEAFGTPTLNPGPATITPTGIESLEAFGTPEIERVARGLAPRPKDAELGDVIHEFSSSAGILPDVPISGWEATEDVPGGYISCSGVVEPSFVRDHPEIFIYGATWRCTIAQTGETIWAGRLLDPTPQTLGAFQLNAKGWGTIPDRNVDRLLYQTRATDDWVPADNEPHSYTNANKQNEIKGEDFVGSGSPENEERHVGNLATIEYTIPTGDLDDGETYVFGIRGRTKDVNDEEEKVRIKFSILEDGEVKDHVERDVTNTYDNSDPIEKQKKENDHLGTVSCKVDTSKTYKMQVTTTKMKPAANAEFVLAGGGFSKTANITSEKIQSRVTGRQLKWAVGKGTKFHGGETTGLVFWAVNNPLSRIAFTIEKPTGNSEKFELVLFGTTGPDGDLVQLHAWDLERAGNVDDETIDDNLNVDFKIRGDYDQIMLALRRREGAQGKKQKRFVLAVSEVRVSGIAENDDFSISDVAEDIASRMSMDSWLIKTSREEVLPLDAVDTTFGDVLTDVHLLADWRWLVLDFGNGPVLDSGPWTQRVWTVHGSYGMADLVPLERYDQVRYPYRYAGGERQWDVAFPEKDPLPKGTLNTYVLNLDDPLPGKDVMEMVAQRLADYFCKKRAGGSANLATVEDQQGLSLSAYHVHAGDEIYFSAFGMQLRVKSVIRTDKGVSITFDDKHALYEQVIARRKRLLAMGRSAADATLQAMGIDRPTDPQGVEIEFFGREQRDRLEYKMRLNWLEVINDLNGNATSIDRYRYEVRPMEPVEEFAANPNPDDYAEGDYYYNTTAEEYRRHNGATWAAAVVEEGDDWIDVDNETAFPRFVFPDEEPNKAHVERGAIGGKEDDDGPDVKPPTHVWLGWVDRPKKWWYQGRVRAIDEGNQAGPFSDWTVPKKASPNTIENKPPRVTMISHPGYVPDNGLYFDRGDKSKYGDKLRGILQWEELKKWDIPGGDKDNDIRGYAVEFRRCTSGGADIAGEPKRQAFISVKRDRDVDEYVEKVYHRVRKNKYYQFRIMTKAEYGIESDWYGGPGATDPDGWSLPVQCVDDVLPPDVEDLAGDLDRKFIRAQYNIPNDPVDVDNHGDPVPHEDIRGVLLRVYKPNGSVWKGKTWRMGLKENFVERVSQPEAGDWEIRVATVDHSDNKSHEWDDPAIPTVVLNEEVPPEPTGAGLPSISYKRGARRGILGEIKFTYGGGASYLDDDITHFIVEWQEDETNPVAGTQKHRRIVKVKPSEIGDEHKVLTNRLHKGDKIRFRYAPVNSQGKQGNWSNETTGTGTTWSGIDTVTNPRKPGAVRNKTTHPKTRGALVKYDPPDRYQGDGATNPAFSEEDVLRYRVSLFDKFSAPFDVVEVKGTRAWFPMTKAEVTTLAPFTSVVVPIGLGEDQGDSFGTDGSVTPEAGGADSFADLDGDIDYSQFGTLGALRFGPYGTATEGSGSTQRVYLTGAPSGQNGDAIFNSSDKKMYKYDSSGNGGAGRWYRLVEGSDLVADTVTARFLMAGALEAYSVGAFTITSGTFKTAPSGTRIELSGDNLRIYAGSTEVGHLDGRTSWSGLRDGSGSSFHTVLLQSTYGLVLDVDIVNILSVLDMAGNINMNGNNINGVANITGYSGNLTIAPTKLTLQGIDAPKFHTDSVNQNPSITSASAAGRRILPGTGGTSAESVPNKWFKVLDSAGTTHWLPGYT